MAYVEGVLFAPRTKTAKYNPPLEKYSGEGGRPRRTFSYNIPGRGRYGPGETALSLLTSEQQSQLTQEARRTLATTPARPFNAVELKLLGAYTGAQYRGGKVIYGNDLGQSAFMHEGLHALVDRLYSRKGGTLWEQALGRMSPPGFRQALASNPTLSRSLVQSYSQSPIAPISVAIGAGGEQFAQAGMFGPGYVPKELQSFYTRIFNPVSAMQQSTLRAQSAYSQRSMAGALPPPITIDELLKRQRGG